jgi:N6-L-threonylcarbamoyladenine synthase
LPILGKALRPQVIRQGKQVRVINYKDIDVVAVTAGPGLITSLLVGAETARVLSYLWQKPLVAVNHIEAHIYANWLLFSRHFEERSDEESRTNVRPRVRERSFASLRMTERKIEFPVLCLVVSGGHTELVLMRGHGKYKVIGETRDDAAGECFDKTAKILGLGYPGGPAIAAEAAKFKISDFRFQIDLPRPMMGTKDFDFSFSGLKTAVLYGVRDFENNHPQPLLEKEGNRGFVPAMAYKIQEAIVDVLVAKTMRAAKKYDVKTVMLAGGVSANLCLREKFMEAMEKELPKTKYQIPDTKYCTDNAAMIAVAGYFHAIKKDFIPWQKLKVDPNWEL